MEIREKEGEPYLYEGFMKYAYGYSDRIDKNGADAGFFQMLINAEDRPSVIKHLKKTPEQILNQTKGYISNAIDNFLKNKRLLDSEKNILLDMKTKLVQANDSEALFKVIELSFPILERFSEF